MIGWIARDKDGELLLFDQKPYRDSGVWNVPFSASIMAMDSTFLGFSIEWEDDPVKVKLTIEVAE